MAIKFILFDLDGTLIDSSEGIIKSIHYALNYYGMEETDDTKLRKFIGPPLHESFKKHYNFSDEKSKEAVKIYRERYHKIGVYECSLYPGVAETIKELRELGYKIGLASSKPEVMCETILDYHHVRDLFDDVAGATLDGRITNKEEVLDEFFRRHSDYDRSEIVLIGDTIYDINGANYAGIKCIGVSYGFGSVEEMKDAGVIDIVDSLETLTNAIKNIK